VVSQYRLAAHLGLAMILFGYVFWTALEISGTQRTRVDTMARFAPYGVGLVALIFVQIILGAFMAGLDAGRAFSTWPTYAGMWVPAGLYDLSPWWTNHFENHALVHFQHRTVGYVAAAMVLWLYIACRRAGADRAVRIAGIHALVLTGLQIALGIFTVVSQIALPLAALHQICALGVFGAALWWAYALNADTAHAV
jgi:cytochrome c oxidase assembly protein subunit 15